MDVQALASGHPLLFSGQSIVCDRVPIAQSCYRLVDRQGRPDTLRALPVRADRSRPAHFAIDGEVDHAMLIGIAIGDGAIKSIENAAETYVPGFKGTEYGKTPIRDLLQMSSGVEIRRNQGR